MSEDKRHSAGESFNRITLNKRDRQIGVCGGVQWSNAVPLRVSERELSATNCKTVKEGRHKTP